MKNLESIKEVENSLKNSLLRSYDLRLNEEKTVSVRSCCERKKKEDESTETVLKSLNYLEQPSNVFTLIDIGFDTEYVSIPTIYDKRKTNVSEDLFHLNYLVSTQYYVHLMTVSSDQSLITESEWKDVLFHKEIDFDDSISKEKIHSNRINFSEFIHLIYQKGVDENKLRFFPNKVNLICHFNNVDIDKFKDLYVPQYKGELPFIKHCQTVRKTLSNSNSLKCVDDKSNESKKTFKLDIVDTLNLTPLKCSLENVGVLVSEFYKDDSLKKLDVGDDIEDMLSLKHSNVEKFIQYSQTDAIIPVKYVDMLRQTMVKVGLNKYPILDSQKNEVERWNDFKGEFNRAYKIPNTLTSIGSKILNEVIWNNSNHQFYSSKEVQKIKGFYGKFYKRNIHNPKLEWWLMLGYKLPFRPNYGDETTTDGRGKSNYIGTSSNRTPFQYVEDNLPLIKKTYYGGRNEQLFYGVTPIDEYFDYDLVSAYPSAMMTIGLIDWDHPIDYFKDGKPNSNIITDFENYVSYFHIKSFKFPKDVNYPTIPIRNVQKNGIIFPIEGNEHNETEFTESGTYINGVEIHMALELGAEIELGRGIVFPMDRSIRPYEKFIKHTIKERRIGEKHKNEFIKLFWKEIMNSLYGKTAMGVSEKKVFNIQTEKSVTMGEDKITSYPIVSIVTSLVRSMLGMMMNNIKKMDENYFIGNVTTDGFTTNFPNDEQMWKKICNGKLFNVWKEGRDKVENLQIENILEDEQNKKNIIETKHSISQYFGFRTRGQSTLRLDKETDSIVDQNKSDNLMVALGNHRTPSKDETNSNVQSVWWFCNRFNGMKFNSDYFKGIRLMLKENSDSVKISQLRRVSMDFDFKRMPIVDSIKDVEVEYIDVMDEMKFGYLTDTVNVCKMKPYFTVNFVDSTKLSSEEVSMRKRKTTVPFFETKPIKNIDEYETIRNSWKRYQKKLNVDSVNIRNEFDNRLNREIRFDRNDWLKIVDKINGKEVQFDVNENGLEFLNVTINGFRTTINYNEIRNDIEEHFKSKSIMNTSTNIQNFFQFFLNNSSSFNDGVERHQSKIGNSEIDLDRELVQSLCLSKKMKWYGLNMKRTEMSDIEFCMFVYHLFYDDSQLSKIFKIVEYSETDKFEFKLRKKIERRINSISYDWNNFSNIQKRWKTLKLRFESESNEKLIHLKNVICPILEIEYFNGTYDFGEKLPSIDESLPIKGQQRKNDHFSEIKNGMISQMLNSINYRKEELLEKEHSMV